MTRPGGNRLRMKQGERGAPSTLRSALARGRPRYFGGAAATMRMVAVSPA
jgi:hypothetical protein